MRQLSHDPSGSLVSSSWFSRRAFRLRRVRSSWLGCRILAARSAGRMGPADPQRRKDRIMSVKCRKKCCLNVNGKCVSKWTRTHICKAHKPGLTTAGPVGVERLVARPEQPLDADPVPAGPIARPNDSSKDKGGCTLFHTSACIVCRTRNCKRSEGWR